MSYLTYLLLSAIISLSSLWILSRIMKRRIWILDKGFLYTLIIFHILWWIGDAIALKLNHYIYNPTLMLNINFLGIPLEDHIAPILIVFWMRGLFDLFERRA